MDECLDKISFYKVNTVEPRYDLFIFLQNTYPKQLTCHDEPWVDFKEFNSWSTCDDEGQMYYPKCLQ